MYQAMKIKFINHSSIIIDTGKEKYYVIHGTKELRLLMDGDFFVIMRLI